MTWLWTVVASWTVLSVPVALLLGRGVLLAEQREIASDWWQDGADRGSGLPGVVPFPFAGDGLTA